MKLSTTCITVCALVSSLASAFTVQPATREMQYTFRTGPSKRKSETQLYDVIAAEAADGEVFDEGLGGVRLAGENAIKVSGIFENDSVEAKDLTRYIKVTELSDEIISKTGGGITIISTGMGKELYKDPGASTTKEIVYAPLDAVKNALSSVPNASVSNANKVVLNFLGGDDLMIFEVMDAVKTMVDGLDTKKQTEVTFNSLCDSQFPNEVASVTVVATAGNSDDKQLTGVDKCILEGEIYFHEGKYWTVSDDDINTAIA